jgi:hypothetical protein
MTDATNPLTYNGYITAVATLAVEPVTETSGVVAASEAFTALVPSMLNYAELRIQRDVDLLALQTAGSYATAALNNVLSIPTEDFVTIQTLSIGGVPLTAVSKEFLQNVYGSSTGAAQPVYFAPYGGDAATAGLTSSTFLLGPYPDTIYTVGVTGTVRMPSLNQYATQADAGDKYTFISTWLPDLLVQASMIFISEYQRNFSATGSDPQMPVNYETQYQALLRGAAVEEARRRFSASAWSSMAPPVAATPAR